MSRFLVVCILAMFGGCATTVAVVQSQPKPDLGEAITLAYVDCPDSSKDGCFFLQLDKAYYVVKGTYEEEEYIWKLNIQAAEQGLKQKMKSSPWEYLTLIWSKHVT